MVNSYSVFFAAAAAFYVAGPSLALPQPGLVEYSDSVAARELSDSYLEAREPEDFARNDGREVKNDPKAAKGKNPKKKHSKCKGLKGAKRAACLKAKKGKHGKKAPKSQNKREPEDVLETRSFGEDLDLEAREPEDFARNDGREVKNDPKATKGKNPKKKSHKCKGLKGAKRAACLKAAKKGKHGKKAPKSQNKREFEDVLETRSFGEDLDLEAREPEDFVRNDGREVKNDPKAAKGKHPKKKHSKCKGLKGAKRSACLKAAKKGKHGKKTPKGNGKQAREDTPLDELD